MLYRTFAALIVVFWLTMSALLIRNEIGAGDARLRAVPVAHVLRILFTHEQSSGLNIYLDKARIGHVRLDPQVNKADGTRFLKFTGNIQLNVPLMNRQRLWWDGVVEMTRLLEVRRAQFGFSFREVNRDSAASRVQVSVDPPAHVGSYEVLYADRILEAHQYSLDEKGVGDLLRQLEIAPAIVSMVGGQLPTDPPEITALQSSLEMRGEKIDTFLVTIRQKDQTLADVHVSQLGRVLRVTTLLGVTLSPEELSEP